MERVPRNPSRVRAILSEMAKEGKNALFIKEETEKRIPRIRTSFVIDSLSYLQKGGRCSSVEAFLGSAMRIHPVLRVEEGKIVSGKKLRGKMKRVYELYYESLKNEMLDADPKRVFLTHSGCDETSLELIRKSKSRKTNSQFFDLL